MAFSLRVFCLFLVCCVRSPEPGKLPAPFAGSAGSLPASTDEVLVWTTLKWFPPGENPQTRTHFMTRGPGGWTLRETRDGLFLMVSGNLVEVVSIPFAQPEKGNGFLLRRTNSGTSIPALPVPPEDPELDNSGDYQSHARVLGTLGPFLFFLSDDFSRTWEGHVFTFRMFTIVDARTGLVLVNRRTDTPDEFPWDGFYARTGFSERIRSQLLALDPEADDSGTAAPDHYYPVILPNQQTLRMKLVYPIEDRCRRRRDPERFSLHVSDFPDELKPFSAMHPAVAVFSRDLPAHRRIGGFTTAKPGIRFPSGTESVPES